MRRLRSSRRTANYVAGANFSSLTTVPQSAGSANDEKHFFLCTMTPERAGVLTGHNDIVRIAKVLRSPKWTNAHGPALVLLALLKCSSSSSSMFTTLESISLTSRTAWKKVKGFDSASAHTARARHEVAPDRLEVKKPTTVEALVRPFLQWLRYPPNISVCVLTPLCRPP